MAESILTFAFVDLAGYTARTEAHGDESAADCASRFYALAQASLFAGVRIVKRIGDAVMLAGTDPIATVSSVLDLFGAAAREPSLPELRAGLEMGPAVEREGDYFGAAVNLAARISAHARAGEVLCGEGLAKSLAGGERVRLAFLGAVDLKNVSTPVRIHSILPGTLPPASVPIDPVCRMKVAQPHGTIEHAGSTYVFCSDACADRFRASPGSFLKA